MINFARVLSSSEAKYKYLGLTKAIREEFPEKDVLFDVKFQGKIYKMKVNNKNCIMLTQLYEKQVFLAGDELQITEIKSGIFEFKVNR